MDDLDYQSLEDGDGIDVPLQGGTVETTLLLMQPQKSQMAYRERGGRIWRVRNHGGGISLEQVRSIITATGIPLSGWDDLLDPQWCDQLPWQACPAGTGLRKIATRVRETWKCVPFSGAGANSSAGRIAGMQIREKQEIFVIFDVERRPANAYGHGLKVSAIEMLFAMHQLLEAYSEARSSLTGFADKKTVKWLRTASRRSRALARHLADSRDRFQIACSGPSFETFKRFLRECEKYADRFDFVAQEAAVATKTEKALLRFMDHLVPCFEYLFGEQATSGWNHRGSETSDAISSAPVEADSPFIRFAYAFFQAVGHEFKKSTIHTALYDWRKETSPKKDKKKRRRKRANKPV
jgi:hypothetical protein